MKHPADSIKARTKVISLMIESLKNDSLRVQLKLKEMKHLNRLLSEDCRRLALLEDSLSSRDNAGLKSK